jgi:pilus assembly protein Flp/PilA
MRDDSGATMVEYGIMIALIAAVCILVVTAVGTNVSSAFNSANTTSW